MEFPDLGRNCFHRSCNRLDFLPMKCDACGNIFCCNHIKYDSHACTSSYKKNVQVPVCPLCDTPVPVARGELPDLKVGDHIDRDCQSDPAKFKRKSNMHRCSVQGCRNREFVPVVCPSCRKNYCFQHRNVLDHECGAFQRTGRSLSNPALAALNRQKHNQTNPSSSAGKITQSQMTVSQNGFLSDDEALTKAIHLSLNDSKADSVSVKPTQEELDRRLAEALSLGDEFYQSELRRQQDLKRSCVIS